MSWKTFSGLGNHKCPLGCIVRAHCVFSPIFLALLTCIANKDAKNNFLFFVGGKRVYSAFGKRFNFVFFSENLVDSNLSDDSRTNMKAYIWKCLLGFLFTNSNIIDGMYRKWLIQFWRNCNGKKMLRNCLCSFKTELNSYEKKCIDWMFFAKM